MKITSDPNQGAAIAFQSPGVSPAKNERASAPSSTASTVEKPVAGQGTSAVPAAQRQTDVTYRRDSNGRVYYAVSDRKSGQEIYEVPAKVLRDVGQGIEDYLKAQQSSATPQIKIKA